MISRAIRIAFVLTVVAVVCFLYFYNSSSVNLSFGPLGSFSIPLAILVISTFTLGGILAATIAAIFGLKMRWVNHRFARLRQLHEQHKQAVDEARGWMALGDYRAAIQVLGKIIARDPDYIGARVLLSESHRRSGDLRTALAVLEEARVEQRKNVELLLLASEINEALGNHTAALDNAALVLRSAKQNPIALKRVVSSYEQLQRYQDAILHQQQLVQCTSGEDYQLAQEKLAQLLVSEAARSSAHDKATFRTKLQEILRNHRDNIRALELLAELEEESGAIEKAVQIWKRLFALTGSALYLEHLAATHLRSDQATKALADVRLLLEDFAGKERQKNSEGVLSAPEQGRLIEARLFLIHLLLHLEMTDHAADEMEKLNPLVKRQKELGRGDYSAVTTMLKAQILRRRGKDSQALKVFLDFCAEYTAIPKPAMFKRAAVENAPRPQSFAERTTLAYRTEQYPPLSS